LAKYIRAEDRDGAWSGARLPGGAAVNARDIAPAAAAGAVVIGFISYTVEVQAIVRRPEVRPERTSWLIWALQYVAYFAAQLTEGGTRGSLWLVGEELAGVLVIYALSLRYGIGGRLIRRARHHRRAGRRLTPAGLLLAGVCAALTAWSLTRSAAVAVLLLSAVELAGAAPTVAKMYRLPGSEPKTTWLLVGVAGVLAVPALGTRPPAVLYAYPATLIITGAGVVAASWLAAPRRTQKGAHRCRPGLNHARVLRPASGLHEARAR
jgi:hypothetical protein